MKKILLICSLFAGGMNAANNIIEKGQYHVILSDNGMFELRNETTRNIVKFPISDVLDLIKKSKDPNCDYYNTLDSIIRCMLSRTNLNLDKIYNLLSIFKTAIDGDDDTSDIKEAFNSMVDFFSGYTFGLNSNSNQCLILNNKIKQSIIGAVMLYTSVSKYKYKSTLENIQPLLGTGKDIIQMLCKNDTADSDVLLYDFFIIKQKKFVRMI